MRSPNASIIWVKHLIVDTKFLTPMFEVNLSMQFAPWVDMGFEMWLINLICSILCHKFHFSQKINEFDYSALPMFFILFSMRRSVGLGVTVLIFSSIYSHFSGSMIKRRYALLQFAELLSFVVLKVKDEKVVTVIQFICAMDVYLCVQLMLSNIPFFFFFNTVMN